MIYNIAKMMADTGVSADGAVTSAIAQMNAGAFAVPHFGTVTSDGGTLYFESGRYDLTGKLVLPRHCHARGDGDASMLVWANGAGAAFEPFPNLNYSNYSSFSDLTLINDAPPRELPDPKGPERYVGLELVGGTSQVVKHVWTIGWETHYRCSQTELISIRDVRMFGRQIDELKQTYGLHVCTLPGAVGDSTNFNWFERVLFNGPYFPYVHDDGLGNVLRHFHVNQSGPMLLTGSNITLANGSFEGGPEEACIRSGAPASVPFQNLLIDRCYSATSKSLLRITDGTPYGLRMRDCFTLSDTCALVQNDTALLCGPVTVDGCAAWGQAPVWGGNDVYWNQAALYASTWYRAPTDVDRCAVGVGTLLPNGSAKLQVRDP